MGVDWETFSWQPVQGVSSHKVSIDQRTGKLGYINIGRTHYMSNAPRHVDNL